LPRKVPRSGIDFYCDSRVSEFLVYNAKGFSPGEGEKPFYI
jgi:hypothetical protein